jgi:histidinol-phosphate aminotransferase
MALTRRNFVEALGVAGVSIFGPSSALAQGVTAAAPPLASAPTLIRLDQNENPFAPGPAITKAVTDALTLGNRYPGNIGDLASAVAKLRGVARENVLLAAGSGELLRSVIPAFVAAHRPLVAGTPTFETCTRTALNLGLPVREVPIDKGLRLDLAGMEEAAGGAGLLFFCNPNNPTGATWPTRDVEAMIGRLGQRSPETLTVVDEAYAEFVESKDYWSLAGRAATDRRVLVTRTFSKACGLAGMRVGYAIGHKDTIARLRLTTTSGMLPVTSVAAALAALADQPSIREQVVANNRTRATAARDFEELGFKVFPSDANFILVDVRRKPEDFRTACRERGIAVGRPFPGLDTHSRISIGTAEEMRRAAEVFKAVLS